MVAVLAVVVATSCGDSASADEERVCTAVQSIVDALAGARSVDAVLALGELETAVDATTNETMAAAGAAFFDVLDTDVDRFQLTLDEVNELGAQYQRDSAAALDTVVAECRSVGAPIEGLPQA